jgi:anti-sigma B factor antagonist
MSVVDPKAFVSHTSDGAAVLWLDGELDAQSAPLIAEWVTTALEAGVTDLVLDLRDVATVDVTGLQAVAAAQADAAREGSSVHLRSPSKRTIDLLLMTGLDRTLVIDPSRE